MVKFFYIFCLFRKSSEFPAEQMSEEEKQEVSEEVRKAQREMAAKNLRKKLEEIEMTDFEEEKYRSILQEVASSVSQLRLVLESLESKSKERKWVKRKTEGDLDETRLVEGITGERAVYKKRGEEKSFFAGHMESKIRILFVLDVSASMYHFDSQDGRLQRLLSCVVMIIEAFKSFSKKYSLAVYGHSGDAPLIPFVEFGEVPGNAKDVLRILKKMQAHTEYCASGDHTLEAIQMGVDLACKEEAGDYFCFVLSDANLSRYHLSAEQVCRALNRSEKVNSFVIFIASVDNEADQLKKALPVGKAHICLNNSKLPLVFKQIFTEHMLKDF